MTKVITTKTWRIATPTYHTSWECPHVGANHHEVADGDPRLARLRLCRTCAGEATADTPREAECPFCETRVSTLPNHLPCESSP